MEIFSIIVGVVIIVLVIIAIVTVFKYPKQILINAPAGFLKTSAERFLSSIAFITFPVWLPIWFLDNRFKWGIFRHKFFKLFYEFDADDAGFNGLPDKEYTATKKLPFDFEHFTKYFISSMPDAKRLVSCLEENLDNIGKSLSNYEVFRVGGLTIIRINRMPLYDFNLLIQCLDNDFKRSKNFGFAQSAALSFFGVSDQYTLNNIVGQTSMGEHFAFNLVSGHEDYLTISQEIKLRSKYTTAFFNELIEKISDYDAQ